MKKMWWRNWGEEEGENNNTKKERNIMTWKTHNGKGRKSLKKKEGNVYKKEKNKKKERKRWRNRYDEEIGIK